MPPVEPGEEWRPIEHFPGYLISSYGRLWLKSKRLAVLTPDKNGFLATMIINEFGASKRVTLHWLVVTTFISTDNNYVKIAHKDGDKTNNRVDNLEYAIRGVKNGNEGIIQYTLSAEYIATYDTREMAMLSINRRYDAFSNSLTYACDRGTECYGFLWSNLGEELNGLKPLRFESLPGEEWKIIPEYPGYRISTHGRLMLKSGQLATSTPSDNDGYVSTNLSSASGNIKAVRLHVLVAKAFLEPVEGKTIVNHIDGNRSNNCVSNLEWVTYQENAQRRVFPAIKSTKSVLQYTSDGSTLLAQYKSAKEAAAAVVGSNICISNACKRHIHYFGFTWRYLYDVVIYEGEEWRDIEVNGVIVSVSSIGRVKSSYGITFGCNKGGYKVVSLQASGKSKGHLVHRLVAKAFLTIDNPDNYVVNHKDNVHDNNNVSNLEYVTQRENIIHGRQFKTREHGKSKPVNQFNLDGTYVATYPSMMDATRATGVTGVGNACKRSSHIAGDFLWYLAEQS